MKMDKVPAIIGFLLVLSSQASQWTSPVRIKNCSVDYRKDATTNYKERVVIVTDETTPTTFYYLFNASDAMEMQKGKGMLASCLSAQSTGAKSLINWDTVSYAGTFRRIVNAVQVGPD